MKMLAHLAPLFLSLFSGVVCVVPAAGVAVGGGGGTVYMSPGASGSGSTASDPTGDPRVALASLPRAGPDRNVPAGWPSPAQGTVVLLPGSYDSLLFEVNPGADLTIESSSQARAVVSCGAEVGTQTVENSSVDEDGKDVIFVTVSKPWNSSLGPSLLETGVRVDVRVVGIDLSGCGGIAGYADPATTGGPRTTRNFPPIYLNVERSALSRLSYVAFIDYDDTGAGNGALALSATTVSDCVGQYLVYTRTGNVTISDGCVIRNNTFSSTWGLLLTPLYLETDLRVVVTDATFQDNVAINPNGLGSLSGIIATGSPGELAGGPLLTVERTTVSGTRGDAYAIAVNGARSPYINDNSGPLHRSVVLRDVELRDNEHGALSSSMAALIAERVRFTWTLADVARTEFASVFGDSYASRASDGLPGVLFRDCEWVDSSGPTAAPADPLIPIIIITGGDVVIEGGSFETSPSSPRVMITNIGANATVRVAGGTSFRMGTGYAVPVYRGKGYHSRAEIDGASLEIMATAFSPSPDLFLYATVFLVDGDGASVALTGSSIHADENARTSSFASMHRGSPSGGGGGIPGQTAGWAAVSVANCTFSGAVPQLLAQISVTASTGTLVFEIDNVTFAPGTVLIAGDMMDLACRGRSIGSPCFNVTVRGLDTLGLVEPPGAFVGPYNPPSAVITASPVNINLHVSDSRFRSPNITRAITFDAHTHPRDNDAFVKISRSSFEGMDTAISFLSMGSLYSVHAPRFDSDIVLEDLLIDSCRIGIFSDRSGNIDTTGGNDYIAVFTAYNISVTSFEGNLSDPVVRCAMGNAAKPSARLRIPGTLLVEQGLSDPTCLFSDPAEFPLSADGEYVESFRMRLCPGTSAVVTGVIPVLTLSVRSSVYGGDSAPRPHGEKFSDGGVVVGISDGSNDAGEGGDKTKPGDKTTPIGTSLSIGGSEVKGGIVGRDGVATSLDMNVVEDAMVLPAGETVEVLVSLPRMGHGAASCRWVNVGLGFEMRRPVPSDTRMHFYSKLSRTGFYYTGMSTTIEIELRDQLGVQLGTRDLEGVVVIVEPPSRDPEAARTLVPSTKPQYATLQRFTFTPTVSGTHHVSYRLPLGFGAGQAKLRVTWQGWIYVSAAFCGAALFFLLLFLFVRRTKRRMAAMRDAVELQQCLIMREMGDGDDDGWVPELVWENGCYRLASPAGASMRDSLQHLLATNQSSSSSLMSTPHGGPATPGTPMSSGAGKGAQYNHGQSFTVSGGGEVSVAGIPPVSASAIKRLCRPSNVVGSGSFADVYRAKLGGEIVAVKRLRVGPGVDQSKARASFAREAALLRDADHPNVLKVLGACLEKGSLALVTEFAPGGSVHGLIQRGAAAIAAETGRSALNNGNGNGGRGGNGGGRRAFDDDRGGGSVFGFGDASDSAADVSSSGAPRRHVGGGDVSSGIPPLEARLSVAHGIARGMAFLHSREPCIVHRDLSTHNVLLAADGSPRIADFGLARSAIGSHLSTVSTAGTPAFMAPELLRGEPVNERIDVYAFGVIMWSLWVLDTPWKGLRFADIVRTIAVEGSSLDASRITGRPWGCFASGTGPAIDEIAADYRSLCAQCLSPNPTVRPTFECARSQLRRIEKALSKLRVAHGLGRSSLSTTLTSSESTYSTQSYSPPMPPLANRSKVNDADVDRDGDDDDDDDSQLPTFDEDKLIDV